MIGHMVAMLRLRLLTTMPSTTTIAPESRGKKKAKYTILIQSDYPMS